MEVKSGTRVKDVPAQLLEVGNMHYPCSDVVFRTVCELFLVAACVSDCNHNFWLAIVRLCCYMLHFKTYGCKLYPSLVLKIIKWYVLKTFLLLQVLTSKHFMAEYHHRICNCLLSHTTFLRLFIQASGC
jgi:hypothetical protein